MKGVGCKESEERERERETWTETSDSSLPLLSLPPPLIFLSRSSPALSPSHTLFCSQIAGVMIDFQPSPITFLKPVTLILPVYELDTELHHGRAFRSLACLHAMLLTV